MSELKDLTYPTEESQLLHGSYPAAFEYGGNDDVVVHPVIALLKEGKPITHVEVTDEWTDDHCPCYDLVITVNGCKYGISVWWMAGSGTRMVYHAEAGKKKAMKELAEHLIDVSVE